MGEKMIHLSKMIIIPHETPIIKYHTSNQDQLLVQLQIIKLSLYCGYCFPLMYCKHTHT